MSFLFGCFKGKNSKDAKRSIQGQPPRPEPSNNNGSRVLPHQGAPDVINESCVKCGMAISGDLNKVQIGRSNSVGHALKDTNQEQKKRDQDVTIGNSNARSNSVDVRPEGAGSYAINDDSSKTKPKAGKMCENCQKKEGSATTGNNLEVLSNGSHRDDVSQSTMAARSSKTLAEGNTTLKGGEMNATMTTIDGSDRGRYRQVLPPKMTPEENRLNQLNCEKFKQYRYKKYFFLKPAPYAQPELANDSSSRRIKEELDLYHELKAADRIVEVDGGLTYYLICGEWIRQWRDFVQNKGKKPGPITNEGLTKKISNQRQVEREDRYKAHDNQIAIKESDEVYTLSRDFWHMFESRYHCDIVVQIRKFSDILSLVKEPIIEGECWSAFQPQLESHWEPMLKKLRETPVQNRHGVESQHMDQLQSDRKLWKRYYAISTQWVSKWLNYVQAEDRSTAEHPGPVDNERIKESVCAMKPGQENNPQSNNEFYTINKHLYYYFLSLYGGGPTLVLNNFWKNTELQYIQMRGEQESYADEESKNSTNRYNGSSRRNQQQQQEPDPMIKKYQTLPNFEDGIVGLENNTFYCYMNACLQCLVPIHELRDHFILQNYYDVARSGATRTRNVFDFCNRIHDFFDIVYSKSSSDKRWTIKPTLKTLLRRRFDPILQHDSHEFMIYLLERLQEEQTPVQRPNFDGSDDKKPIAQICQEYTACYSTNIDRIFSGIMQTIVKCGKCRHESITCGPFMTQSLQHKTSLFKCLQDYYTESTLDDYYTCESCHKKTKARKRHQLVKLPKVLVFHIKRFDSNFRKIEKNTSYTADLNMDPFCMPDIDPNLRGNTNYQLFALTVHHGTLSGGHYVAYSLRDDGKWYNFNDEYYQAIKESEALKQQAYLLFYRQVS